MTTKSLHKLHVSKMFLRWDPVAGLLVSIVHNKFSQIIMMKQSKGSYEYKRKIIMLVLHCEVDQIALYKLWLPWGKRQKPFAKSSPRVFWQLWRWCPMRSRGLTSREDLAQEVPHIKYFRHDNDARETWMPKRYPEYLLFMMTMIIYMAACSNDENYKDHHQLTFLTSHTVR